MGKGQNIFFLLRYLLYLLVAIIWLVGCIFISIVRAFLKKYDDKYFFKKNFDKSPLASRKERK